MALLYRMSQVRAVGALKDHGVPWKERPRCTSLLYSRLVSFAALGYRRSHVRNH